MENKKIFVQRTLFEEVVNAYPKAKKILLEGDILDSEQLTFAPPLKALMDEVFMKDIRREQGLPALDPADYRFREAALLSLSTFSKWQKMFVVSLGLTQRLVLTDMYGIHPDNIRLPYEDFLIQLPSNDIFPFNEIYVTKLSDSLKICAVPQDNLAFDKDGNKTTFSDNELNKQLKRMGKDELLNRMRINAKLGYSQNWFFELTGDDVGKQIDSFFSKSDDFNFHFLLRFVLNVILYINFKRADISHITVQRSVDEKLGRRNPREISTRIQNPTLLGGSILIDHTIAQDSKKSFAKGPYSGNLLWTVRGHWRRLPHRKALHPNNPETWCTWIEPYVKGNIHGEFVNKKYSAEYSKMENTNDKIENPNP